MYFLVLGLRREIKLKKNQNSNITQNGLHKH